MRGRAIFIAATVVSIVAVHFADPVVVGPWLPFRTSCGAVTGLPCLLCGMTRALHLLLCGDVAGAIYFNWLSIPFLAALICAAGMFALELSTGRQIVNLRALAPFTARRLTICVAAALALWTLNVYLAISQHKSELLNRHGPLYHWFVKD